ncbi:MAG: PQQ-binding-like beta-propeller repeat protein [bacterium]|nr:PQQ-binding-like beta-propeller repeat protein [bacterium]
MKIEAKHAAACLLLFTVCVAHEMVENLTVVGAIPGSAAEAAGVETDDRILRLAGEPIAGIEELRAVLSAHRPGDTVPLEIERDGEPVTLQLKLGARPDGGASLGLRMGIGVYAGAADGDHTHDGEQDLRETECLAWIEKTYAVDDWIERLDLELEETYATVQGCVGNDARRMSVASIRANCDNVFKVHCSGIGLLTEIGEAMVERCESVLRESFDSSPENMKRWRTCGQHRVFDRYSLKGEWNEAACGEALRSCNPKERPPGAVGEAPAAPTESAVEKKVHAAWPQWGGPTRDFKAPSADLAAGWPADGPAVSWRRPLGGGHSAILAEAGRLYTMYRAGEDEIVICLDAGTGKTIWEQRYAHAPHGDHVRAYGNGPNSTPLISGDLLFTVGVAGKMNALQKGDGKLVWSRDLWGDELGGNFLAHGYSSSPVAYEDTVIVPVGGETAGLVAFDRKTGGVRWKTAGFGNSYSSPRLMDLVGERQLVVFMADELIGVAPASGKLLWRFPHGNQWRHNITMPVAVGGDTLFLSSAQAGAKGLRLQRNGESIEIEEIWSTRRIQFYHASSVREGDWVYGSTGTAAPAFLAAVNVRSGEIAWRERGFAKANVIEASGKLVILDEDGVLGLATATPEKLVVHGRTQLLDDQSWTVPTLVGTMLYVRDSRQILALDLG